MDLPDVDNPEEFRCISLCTGYAGLELGIKRVVPTLRTVCYVEVEAFACANLVSKIEAGELDAAPIWTDLKTFDGKPFRKRVHIITAGYPCQLFSCAGKRKGKDDPRHLWPHIERIIKAIQPVWFFGENVPGHLSIGYPTVYRSLRNLGYKVEAGLFTAAEVGAPHVRKRLFILAYTEQRTKLKGASPKKNKLREWPFLQNKSYNRQKMGSNAGSGDRISWPPRPEKVSEIPRATNGTSSRVDRLRLLGNGVVPQQVELAFRELFFEANR